MTSPRSRLRPSSGSSLARLIGLGLGLGLGLGVRAEPSLVRTVGDAEVDWGAGTITARGGAAADFRMPSANVARPGAERRARAVAGEKLRAAITALLGSKPTAAKLDGALARASAGTVDYQSNGGVLLALTMSFGDLSPPPEAAAVRRDGGAEPTRKAPEQALSVAAMPFELAPVLSAGDREVTPAYAIYRAGTPPAGVDAIAVRREKNRLVLPKGSAASLQKLAGAPVLIYVQKISK